VSVLALDTSTTATSVALGARELRHDPQPGERPQHVQRALAFATALVRESAGGWDDIELIAVGTGPGSFTGLRIGIATAHGLATARSLPLAGVSSLRALALNATADGPRPVLAAIDAGRGEAFAASWAGEEELAEPRAAGADELAELVAGLSDAPLAIGNGSLRFRDAIEAAGGEVPPDDSPLHRVSAVNHCLLATGELQAAGPVLPDYLRAPDATPRR
jgi:tRNA threonylcarbamoyladenosine biosynthesis protein TsaB